MKLIVCVDDRMGVMFNSRRQSKDAKVREDMLSMLEEGKELFVSPYTANQFLPEEQERLHISEDFLLEAGEEEFCFVEDKDVLEVVDNVETIILYRWNRHYPSDKYFMVDLSKYELVSSIDFVGNSHPEMLKEEYQKKLEIVKAEVEESSQIDSKDLYYNELEESTKEEVANETY